MPVAAPATERPANDDTALGVASADGRVSVPTRRVYQGRLRDEGLNEGDRFFAIAMHLSPFATIVLGGFWPAAMVLPLVLWLVRRNESAFVDDHGRELLSFGISLVIYHVVLVVMVIGIVVLPVLWIVTVISLVRGGIAASRSEYFRYPMTIRFLS